MTYLVRVRDLCRATGRTRVRYIEDRPGQYAVVRRAAATRFERAEARSVALVVGGTVVRPRKES